MCSISQSKPSMMEEENDAFMFSIQLGNASILAMALRSVIELDLFEMMAKAGSGAYVSPSELASQLPTKNPDAPAMLDRILQFLACNSILNCNVRELPDGGVERLYCLTPVCKFLISNTDGDSIAPHFLVSHDKAFMDSWYHVKDAILDGDGPFEKAHGMTIYEYSATNPKFNKSFMEAMTSQSTTVTQKLLETYKGFEGLSFLVDVGGGSGVTLNMIISKYPTINGINFDVPHVIENAPYYAGVEHIGGNMFVSVPKGDAIFMKHICHSWSDEQCLKLLKNCYEALPDNGKVILAEFILPEVPDNKLFTKSAMQADLHMLVYSKGGKERTEKEFKALAKGAGFEGFRVACFATNIWVMEFFKKI